MSEQELKNLIVVYQQKLNESMSQNIALEARLMNSNQVIDSLNRVIEDLNNKNSEISKNNITKKTTKNSENFS